MITSIHIKNYILIDDLTVDFSSGLNVITGETGAGKSILINAVDIAFGAKVSASVIKKGADKAVIELFVSSNKDIIKKLFKENCIDYSEEIVITREITANSSRQRINGTIVNQNFIKDLREQILDIHSQHQTYAILQPKTHINLLDNFIGENSALLEYKTLYTDYQKLCKDLETAKNTANLTEAQVDFLKFQIDEIEQAAIEDINEEDNLREELIVLENAEKLKELTYGAFWAINGDDGSLTDMISNIKTSVSKAVRLDKNLENTENSLTELAELAREISSDLRRYSESVNNDTQRFDEVQERLFVFDKLKRKYGSSLEEIVNTYEKLSAEYNAIEYSTKNIEELTLKIEQRVKELNILADKISEKRISEAQKLSKLVEKELGELELAKSRFEIRILPAELSLLGKDYVEFYLSTNISQDLAPIAKAASGGELSRVMLALKTVFAQADNIDTVILDEIDTGISGKASQSVAEKIYKLSKHTQIILITHQAIIASKAENHILVTKRQDDTTSVEIKSLDEEEKIRAIASLASGDNSASALVFAKSLLAEK